MTPKEKAKELVGKFSPYAHWDDGASNNNVNSELCALVAVDEILKAVVPECDKHEPYYLSLSNEMTQPYWQEVKQEIEKL